MSTIVRKNKAEVASADPNLRIYSLPRAVKMTAKSIDPCTLTLFCDGVTSAMVQDACCVSVHALHSVADLQMQRDRLDPMAAFIDAYMTASETFKTAINIIKECWPSCAIIAIVPSQGDDEMEQAFIDGAHDIIRKPLRSREILVRMQVRLRDLTELRKTQELSIGDLTVNVIQKRVSRGNISQQLSATTFNVFMNFIEAPNTIVSRQQIKRRVWDGIHVADGAMDRQIHEIRKTLKSLGSSNYIQSVYAHGFQLKLNPTPKSQTESPENPANPSVDSAS